MTPTSKSTVKPISKSAVKRTSRSTVSGHEGLAAPDSGLDGKAAIKKLLDQVDAIEDGSGSGALRLPSGDRLDVSNLGKVFWPKLKLTKGDLFRHYLRVAPYLLPVLADRPLVMKRYPNGVDAKPFYQQRAPDVHPPGVRIETVTVDDETMPRIVGGSLLTLLYTAQLATISQDPWLSRIQSADTIDHAAIDLDPPDDLPFRHVLDVARWVREELDNLKVPGVPEAVRRRRLAHLRADAAWHALRGRSAVLPDRLDAGVDETSEGRHDRAVGQGQGNARVRGLLAEPPWQDTRQRLQCARDRVRGCLDAGHLGGDRQRGQAAGLYRSGTSRIGSRQSAISGRRCGSRREPTSAQS